MNNEKVKSLVKQIVEGRILIDGNISDAVYSLVTGEEDNEVLWLTWKVCGVDRRALITERSLSNAIVSLFSDLVLDDDRGNEITLTFTKVVLQQVLTDW